MRLIDADELKRLRDDVISGKLNVATESDLIDLCPTVDAVEVVRCKDCKYAEMHVDIIGKPHLFCCNGKSIYRRKVDLDDYCSYGERKGV